MKKIVTFKGRCPAFGVDHLITVEYLGTATLSGKTEWTKGLADCSKNYLADQSVCRNCPLINQAPDHLQD